MVNVLRRLALWTLLCSVSAAPSFLIALGEGHDPWAMALGVAVFIGLYTAGTSTPQFHLFSRRPFVRRTLFIGYSTRLLVSAGMFVLPLDIIPGMVSIGFVQNVLGIEATTFVGTLLTTIVQGTLLNVLIALYMLVVWAIQRAVCKSPRELRAFEVILATPSPTATVQPLPVVTSLVEPTRPAAK